jgi:hypothetical protein
MVELLEQFFRCASSPYVGNCGSHDHVSYKTSPLYFLSGPFETLACRTTCIVLPQASFDSCVKLDFLR